LYIGSIKKFLKTIKEYPVNIFLVNGICLSGNIRGFNAYSPDHDEHVDSLLMPYLIIEPLKQDSNDPFPYQLINLNNVVTIQTIKNMGYEG
jgi:small nuclear ribonucleoprotein (snRNP)-like protein